MKVVLLLTALVVIVSSLSAQDLGDLGGFLSSDAGSLLNIPPPRGDVPAGRGAAAGRGAPAARGAQPAGPPADRLAVLRDLLAKANAPLTPQQEAGLNAVMDAEIPA